jgi:potassium efflux system protein
MDAQTRRLLGSLFVLTVTLGAWAIWVDVLPALKFLDQWKLWSYADAAAVVASPDGKPAEAAAAALGWVTLGDVVLAFVIGLMTAVAARNLPGLLEIAWLQRLPLDSGGRYAVAAVSRYVILLVGIVPALRVLGIGWANVQWLAAAMTVGLGFGLQEIFANFISGIIILLERPMRVGDVVTVGGLTGTVSRIRSRATTITDGDNRELIVPNKEFITGQLVNWTLTDRVLRLVVKVGIAFGSDTALATRLLLETARANPLVLRRPAPAAVFTGFGNGALDFELCVFAAGPEHLSRLRHELNMAVDDAFHRADIEIALPPGDAGSRRAARPLTVVDPNARTSEATHEQRKSA